MKSHARDLYKLAWDFHQEYYRMLIASRGKAVDGEESLEDMVDTMRALRDAAKMIDDMRKESDKLRDTVAKKTCLAWLVANVGDVIKTEYATGTPTVKQMPKLPKPGTEEYALLCKHFGIDEASPFRPHWPSMLERISEDLANGKPLPAGCDLSSVYQIFDVAIRSKKPILQDECDYVDTDSIDE